MVAQGAHASMKVMMEKMFISEPTPGYQDDAKNKSIEFTEEELEWVDGIFTKICVSVNSEDELMDCYNKAKEAGLNCSLIEDAGLTEFNGVVTKTCIAIGPNASEKIDLITGHLQLL